MMQSPQVLGKPKKTVYLSNQIKVDCKVPLLGI
jgi:hypothetical protein